MFQWLYNPTYRTVSSAVRPDLAVIRSQLKKYADYGCCCPRCGTMLTSAMTYASGNADTAISIIGEWRRFIEQAQTEIDQYVTTTVPFSIALDRKQLFVHFEAVASANKQWQVRAEVKDSYRDEFVQSDDGTEFGGSHLDEMPFVSSWGRMASVWSHREVSLVVDRIPSVPQMIPLMELVSR